MSEIINFSNLVPLAVFGMIAVAVWGILSYVSSSQRRAEKRLKELSAPHGRREADTSLLKKSGGAQRVLERAAPALSKPLLPKSELETSKLRVRLANAGYRAESAVTVYLGTKVIGLVLGLLIGGGTAASSFGMTSKGMLILALTGGLGFYLPDLIVMLKRRSRRDKIFCGLPDALDLLVVCVEAGLGLDAGMRKVSEEMRHTSPVIAEELAVANFQLQMGRSRREVLHDLGVRTGVDDVRSLAAILIQADRFGSSIAQALRVQSDSMRTRRRQLAEERAAKTAVKLIFPLVLFIFPGIFVVLVGPAAITIARDMFPIMSGGS